MRRAYDTKLYIAETPQADAVSVCRERKLAYDTKLYTDETSRADAVSEGEHAMKLYILATGGDFFPPLHPIYHNYFIQ